LNAAARSLAPARIDDAWSGCGQARGEPGDATVKFGERGVEAAGVACRDGVGDGPVHGGQAAEFLVRQVADRSPAWAATAGTGRSLSWPAGTGANGNSGVAHAIDTIPYSIGYAETSYTSGTAQGYAAIANRDGNYVTPTPAAIAADAAAKAAVTAQDFSIVNQPGPAAYPISGYSWVLISARQLSQPAGQALVSLLSWLTHAGRSYAARLGYDPLPPAVQRLEAATLAQVTGHSGSLLAA
jgi:phosphate transport system substrate-binding protein